MTKLSKILRIVAAAAFLTALAVNVKVTLTDPFVGMSQEAIATGTSGSGTTGINAGRCKCFNGPGVQRFCAASTALSPRAKCSRTRAGDEHIEGCWIGFPPCML